MLRLVDQPYIKVYASKTSHFSIGTSPYYAHQYALGIDIYDQLTLQNYEVLSPVSGKVLQIKEMRAPKPNFRGGIEKEYLTVIQNPDDKSTVFKILHIKPDLKIGQKINLGDPLGKTIRNGYFASWSSPHIHLELKKPQDVLRAKRGLSLPINNQPESKTNGEKKIIKYDQIPVKINHVCDDFFLVQFPDDLYFHINPFYGIKGTNGDSCFIIDGGIPQYKHGLIHFINDKSFETSQPIYLNHTKIGILNGLHGNYGFVNFSSIKLLLNNILIRGISLFLANFYPLIKLIPLNTSDFYFRKNSLQYLKIIAD